MDTLKLAMVQHRSPGADVAENTALAERFIREAKENGADLVLFPECFLTSYYAPDICRQGKPLRAIRRHPDFVRWCESALPDNSLYLKRIGQAAEKNRIGVVITAFTRGGKRPQNSAFLIGRDGNVLLKYAKVHTCDFDWEGYLEGGTAFSVASFDGVGIGLMICYDREYPESGRELMLQGAELVLVPNDCDVMRPRLQELSVQAMQNMYGVAMANPPGENAGNSCAYHPLVWDRDNTIVVADSGFDGLVYATFDMRAIRQYRAEEFLGKNRQPQAYRHLLDAAPTAGRL